MTFDDVRNRFAKFMLTDDTTDPPISTTDRDSLINEAYLEYLARFTNVFRGGNLVDYGYTNPITWQQPLVSALIGIAADGQWIECETVEYTVDTLNYTPLKRVDFFTILQLVSTEGATAPAPELYGISLKDRNLITGRSRFLITTYPSHFNINGKIRARIRSWPADLANGADVLLADGIQGDYIARIAAMRAGLTLGYGIQWLRNLAAPLPRELQKRLDLDRYDAWSQSEQPRQVGELVVRGL